ncbi:ABC-three component system middle component 1 [Alteromonas sp. OM2203]|uniref:ABC-three component system middle component 1 n=1 Tax=Alteromonas sp. OM2203 TaxID=3398817 RepID=UPI003AF34D09
MIKQIVQRVAENSSCLFERLESDFEDYSFYVARDPNYQRFLVVLETDQLSAPSELNEQVQACTPPILLGTPSFAKNTDLVILFKLGSLTELKQYEHNIFDIEENAYSLKKHLLYYTSTELEQLNEYLELGGTLYELLANSDAFNRYKQNPTEETAFSLACRLYIKLPFLAVPAQEAILTSANELAEQLLSEAQLLPFLNSIEQKLGDGHTCQEIMEVLINEQMED